MTMQRQYCPGCRGENKVAGMFKPGTLDGVSYSEVYCGFCGMKFRPNTETPKPPAPETEVGGQVPVIPHTRQA
jgi:hypothetical protein